MTSPSIHYLRDQVEKLPAYRILCETAVMDLSSISQRLFHDLVNLHPATPVLREWGEWSILTMADLSRPFHLS